MNIIIFIIIGLFSPQRELREEDKRYREYLRDLKAMEAAREAEMERLCDLEVEKSWEKKLRQWRLEKQARQKLLEDVMRSRKFQIEEKCEFCAIWNSSCLRVE